MEHELSLFHHPFFKEILIDFQGGPMVRRNGPAAVDSTPAPPTPVLCSLIEVIFFSNGLKLDSSYVSHSVTR